MNRIIEIRNYHLLVVVVLGFAILLCFLELRNLKQLVSGESLIQTAENVAEADNGGSIPVTAIVSASLFGVVKPPVNDIQVDLQALPETALQLELKGVVANSNELLSSAMIQGASREVRNYHPGDEVAPDTYLRTVYNDQVILERRGRLETLYFPENRFSAAAGNTSPAARRITAAPASGTAPTAPATSAEQRTNVATASKQPARQDGRGEQRQSSDTSLSLLERLQHLRNNN